MRLGLCCMNATLRKKHIFTARTTRLSTIQQKNKESLKKSKNANGGIEFLLELLNKNLDDLLLLLEWNEKHGIKVFRMSSELAPHITNPALIPEKYKNNYKKFAYSMNSCKAKLRKIGDFAKKHGHRLTFHPGQFVVLSSPNKQTVLRSLRDLYWHATVMDMMGLDFNSVINIHGGGTYGDKKSAMKRWINVFNKMSSKIKRRLVLENDEENYSIEDVLYISSKVKHYGKHIKPFTSDNKYKLPITFDIFHYHCYNATILRHYKTGLNKLIEQKTIDELLPYILRSWGSRRPKMHISEQLKNGPLGAHSNMIKEIPTILRNIPKKYGVKFDLMIEAKYKEKAVLYLMKKYKIK